MKPERAALLSAFLYALALSTAEAQAPAPRVINITSDSEPGWLPSEQQERDVVAQVNAFWAAMDAREFKRAHDMIMERTQKTLPLAEFTESSSWFAEQAGAARLHRIVHITWTKDGPRAPVPGIYAAIDVSSAYEKVDRECGYMILHQPRDGEAFLIARRETNFLDNETAQKIDADKGEGEAEKVWRSLSANCPNYKAE